MSPIAFAETTWDDNGVLRSKDINDGYFSGAGALAEAEHVFVNNSQWPQRWKHWRGECCIVETGFGAGLNTLCTWQAFAQHAHKDARLHIISIEHRPLKLDTLRAVYNHYPSLKPFSEQLLAKYQYLHAGTNVFIWPDQRVRLTLIIDTLSKALPHINAPVHGWYLDGFSPNENPSMWSEPLYERMRRVAHNTFMSASDPHYGISSAVTYTVAGKVRRGLKSAGFNVAMKDSCGKKYHMLSARYQQSQGPEQPHAFTLTPWLQPSHQAVNTCTHTHASHTHDVTVIGAGLAGAHCARALAVRGKRVHVLDPSGIAQGASGNPVGGLYIKLAVDAHSRHTEFYTLGMQHALQRLERDLDQRHWQACGVLQLAYNNAEQSRQSHVLKNGIYPSHLVQGLSADAIHTTLNLTTPNQGLWMPRAGWVSPVHWCHALLAHDNIQVYKKNVTQLLPPTRHNEPWQLTLHDEDTQASHIEHSPCVVLANANGAASLIGKHMTLPTKRIRGQVSYIDPQVKPPNAVLCAQGYMAQSSEALCIGATYNLHSDEHHLTEEDHAQNLEHARSFGAPWEHLDRRHVIGGRVGFRCTSPDYLPIAGKLIDDEAFRRTYAGLAKNAKRPPQLSAPFLPNGYISVAHGSRGLASTSLCADLIAAQICGENTALNESLQAALFPGRFLLRQIIRGK